MHAMRILPPLHRALLLGTFFFGLGALNVFAQQQFGSRTPHIGYIFPAGIQRGATREITVGGQFLDSTKELVVFGPSGVKGTVAKINKPLPQKRLAELSDYLMEARKKYRESGQRPAELKGLDREEAIARILKEAGATDEEIKSFLEIRKERANPKRQQNLQIAETVILKFEVAADAPLGPRELRLLTSQGVSNPLSFCVGSYPEKCKEGPLGKTVETAMQVDLPAFVNGQILPGEVDHYAFQARRGAHLVVAVQARDLIPYLADAVPGWFQPVVALYDAKGREVAFARDYRFSPDPVFCFDVPESGPYLLEIRDALYRGREDFVYRITVGEVPFVTGIFPLGGRVGGPTVVDVSGWNLPFKKFILNPVSTEGIWTVPGLSNYRVISDTSSASENLTDVTEQERSHNNPKQAQPVTWPVIINGHIGAPGEVDVFSFYGIAGQKIVAEVQARRLGSPLDSWLKVTDAAEHQLAFNDDSEDLGAGLLTHKADSYLTFTPSISGTYYIQLGDTQRKGGPDYAYRLRISQPRPEFALRIAPSSINGRPGLSVPVTIYALRKDGFAGDITLALKDAPPGFSLDGGAIPAGQDKVRATITFPTDAGERPVNLTIEGNATIAGRKLIHRAVPAEDMLQAFAYHHLVPVDALVAVARGMGRNAPLGLIAGPGPLQLPVGGVGRIVFAVPQARQGRTFSFELTEPPEGIALGGISPTEKGMEISFRTDPKVKPGSRGNLIVEVFIEQTPALKDGKPQPKNRFSVGFLPAIPFKTVAH